MGWQKANARAEVLDVNGEITITAFDGIYTRDSGEKDSALDYTNATIMHAEQVLSEDGNTVIIPAKSLGLNKKELLRLRDVLNGWFPPEINK
jgi:hypothetical protein